MSIDTKAQQAAQQAGLAAQTGLMEAIGKLSAEQKQKFANLMRNPQGRKLVENAFAMMQNGNGQAWDTVCKIAGMKESPEQLGFWGKLKVRLFGAGKQALLSGAIMAAGTGLFKGAAYGLGFGQTAGTEHTDVAKNANKAMVDARALLEKSGEKAIPGWDKMTKDEQNQIRNAKPLDPIDPTYSIGHQAAVSGGLGALIGGAFTLIGSGNAVAQAEQERMMEMQVFAMMNGGGAVTDGGPARTIASADPMQIERPNVPMGTPAPREQGLFMG